jgi:general secretion pathway protein B
MSFILDALRKSDAERQRGAAPGLADVRYATARRRNVWIPLLALVLTLNIGFMAWQWYAGQDQTAPVAAVAPAAPPAPAASAEAPVATPAIRPADTPAEAPAVRALARETVPAEPVTVPEVQSDLPQLAPVAPQAAVPAPTVPVPTAVSAAPLPTPPPPAAAPPATPSKIIADPALPTLEQLLGAGAIELPPLNLDLLVYNESPAVRFVVINGRKYREGVQLTEGPTLERITPENVILTSRGQRFTLDRK